MLLRNRRTTALSIFKTAYQNSNKYHETECYICVSNLENELAVYVGLGYTLKAYQNSNKPHTDPWDRMFYHASLILGTTALCLEDRDTH
jgi:hypothetical protein